MCLSPSPAELVDVAAHRPRRIAWPVLRQKLARQGGVAKLHATKFVHQERPDDEALFGVERRRAMQRPRHTAEAIDERLVFGRDPAQIPAMADQFL